MHILVIMSDMHAGSRLGLLAPGVLLADGHQVGLGEVQRWLWGCYTDAIEKAATFAQGKPVVLIHNGDACQGDRHGATFAANIADQVSIAEACIDAFARKVDLARVILITGTEAHDFGEASAERILAERLSKRWDVSCTHHLLARVEDVLIDVAHHGPTVGRRVWTRANSARSYLMSRMLEEQREIPDLYFRAHRHRFVDETVAVGTRRSRLIITPGWQALDQFARKATQSEAVLECGMTVLLVSGSAYHVEHLLYTLDLRDEVKL